MANNATLEPAVGINAHSVEWDNMFQRFLEIGDLDEIFFFCGDFGTYDGNMHSQLIAAVVKLVNSWYDDGPENALVREVLIQDIYSPLHINGKTVYRVFHGNPSGNPFTAVMNSIVNSFYMRYCFLRLGKPKGFGLEHYHLYVRAKSYGDDNLFSAHNIVKSFFNMRTVSELLAKHGVEYTDAQKNKICSEETPIEDITFLKRGFSYHEELGRIVAPLDINSINEMANWIKNKIPAKEAIKLNSLCILREMAMYNRTAFNMMRNALRFALADVGLFSGDLPTYDSLILALRTQA